MMGILTRMVGWIQKAFPTLSPVGSNRGGWWPWIREPYSGAWQRNDEWSVDTVAAHHAVYACITLISNDIGKLRPKLVQMDQNSIWSETTNPAFSPVLKKPNTYQNRIQFLEGWVISKLMRGNSYILKERDNRRIVTRLHLLDPSRVQVLVAPNGSIFYALEEDNLGGVAESVTAPASEIIHDRMNCLFHPLVGVSPLFAAGLAANTGLNIQSNSSYFFASGSNPSGILTAPSPIDDATAKRLAARWNELYSGKKSGRVAILGNNLKFEPLRMTAIDSQLIDQLKWSAETVCSTFHVPPFKVALGTMPTYQNGEILSQIYYSDCLQSHIEQIELCLDEGLGLDVTKGGKTLGVELDLDALLRMDTATQIKSLTEAVKGTVMTPNEARRKMDLRPLPGGDTVYMQQQNYSLAALDARDRENPLSPKPTPPPEPSPDPAPDPNEKAQPGFEDLANLILFRMANDNRLLERKAAA
jgi:HK97 family phage portal protein